MPRALNTSKFYILAPKKSGHWKNKSLIGVNYSYRGDPTSITFQDLIDFLGEHKIDPSTIRIESGFMIVAEIKAR